MASGSGGTGLPTSDPASSGSGSKLKNGRIVRLTEDTINRIAAGEVVQRPSSALKELLENSIDAGSTNVKVQVKEGGLKLLSIQDNGSGIKKADLPLLCERFATSKLKTYEDLSSIATYGFRGEALASISHVSHLTVTTKTKEDGCGWKARYLDGKLVPLTDKAIDAEPKAIAANDGTLLLVEDLFYNTPLRRKALRSSADEYSRILDVISKYAIHNAGVAMSCKKIGSNSNDLSTTVNSTTLDVIAQVYAESTRRELHELVFENSEFQFACQGYVSGPNYSAKRGTFVFFINHRLVDCTPLRRNLEAFYTSLLPKGGFPFVYLALQIHPGRVDVNVSPTKSEVHFLDQDDMIEVICDELQKKLVNANQSRTFNVQTLLPGAGVAMGSASRDKGKGRARDDSEEPSSATRHNKTSQSASLSASSGGAFKTPAQRMVRTDANAQTLDAMFAQGSNAYGTTSKSSSGAAASTKKRKAIDLTRAGEDGSDEESMAIDIQGSEDDIKSRSKYRNGDAATASVAGSGAGQTSKSNARAKIPLSECDLTSIQQLRSGVAEGKHAELDTIFKAHTFVGIIDLYAGQSMIQHGTKLYLVNHHLLCDELFYQLGLRQFGSLGKLHLKPPPSLMELMEIAVAHEPGVEEANMPQAKIVKILHKTLCDRAEMLEEYFSVRIDTETGTLLSIPMLLPGWTPDLDKLPLLLLRLAIEVDWTSEKECFSSFLRELAFFNIPEPIPDLDPPEEGGEGTLPNEEEEEAAGKKERMAWQIKHVVFPAITRYLVPPKSLIEGGKDKAAVVHVASLENLYKVFERC